MAEITHHPLMFTFRDVISGHGFLAGITLSGRGLMLKEEDGKWWMYGVRPGAIAECGDSPQDTFLRFKNAYKEVLFDIAAERNDFAGFKEEVERFYYQPDREEERRWEDALNTIRTCGLTLPPPFFSLPRVNPENRPTQISVERLDEQNRRFMPSDNVSDTYLMPTAA